MKWTPVVIDGLSVELLISSMGEQIVAQAGPDDYITTDTLYREIALQLNRAFAAPHGYGSPGPRALWLNVRTLFLNAARATDRTASIRITKVEQKRIHLTYSLTGESHVSLNSDTAEYPYKFSAGW